MGMSPKDLENKAFFSPSRPSLWIFPQLPASHWEEDPVNGGVVTSIEEEPLKCQDCSVSRAKRVLYENLTAELSCSFLAEGGGGIQHQCEQN